MEPVSPPWLIVGGLCLDLLGALVLAAPDLPGLKQRLTPEQLEEARSQFMELGYLSEADPRYEDVSSVMQQNVEWLDDSPYRFVIDHYPARGTEAMYVVYGKDGLGPFDDLEDTGVVEAQERESFDWVADKSVVYEWLGDEIVRMKQQARLIRGVGAIGIAIGFALQLLSYLF